MSKVTLESLAKRVRALEQLIQKEQPVKDWRLAAGLFTPSKLSKQVDAEGRRIREADRQVARRDLSR